MSVLDFPIEDQQRMAARAGKTLEQWRKDVADFLERGQKFAEECVANEVDWDDLTPEEQAREIAWRERLDSENIITASAVVRSRD